MEAALESYRTNLKYAGSLDTPAEDLLEEKEEITGTVLRIASEMTPDDTVYKIILSEQPNKIYRVSYTVSDGWPLPKREHQVYPDILKTEDPVITASGFDNLEFTQ